jgi:hypothetical protein
MQFHDMIHKYNKLNVKGPEGELFSDFEVDRKIIQSKYLDKAFYQGYA